MFFFWGFFRLCGFFECCVGLKCCVCGSMGWGAVLKICVRTLSEVEKNECTVVVDSVFLFILNK